MDNKEFNVIFTCDTSRVLKTKIIIDGNQVGKIDNGGAFPNIAFGGETSSCVQELRKFYKTVRV